VNLKKFDPFNNRLARDIRNTLSKSFLESLAEKDASIFHKRAAEYLKQDLEQVYQEYVETRLDKFDDVFVVIEHRQIHDELKQATILWEHGLYFEMHEFLERYWKGSSGIERKALQGLIRAAGMKIHMESGNTKIPICNSMGKRSNVSINLNPYWQR
jgi:hypothetical protein